MMMRFRARCGRSGPRGVVVMMVLVRLCAQLGAAALARVVVMMVVRLPSPFGSFVLRLAAGGRITDESRFAIEAPIRGSSGVGALLPAGTPVVAGVPIVGAVLAHR